MSSSSASSTSAPLIGPVLLPGTRRRCRSCMSGSPATSGRGLATRSDDLAAAGPAPARRGTLDAPSDANPCSTTATPRSPGRHPRRPPGPFYWGNSSPVNSATAYDIQPKPGRPLRRSLSPPTPTLDSEFNRVMTMRVTTQRWDPDEYDFIAVEAAHAGISIAQFVRVAALARAIFSRGRRDPELVDAWFDLYEAADIAIAMKIIVPLMPPDPSGRDDENP